jgi:hypothetical protein
MDKNPFAAGEMEDFSLVLGGPLYQLLLRARLVRPSMDLVHRRVFACVLITWLPLALLTALAGSFLGGVGVPLVRDLDVHVKFLLSLPILITERRVVLQVVGKRLDLSLENNPDDRTRIVAIGTHGTLAAKSRQEKFDRCCAEPRQAAPAGGVS